MNRTLLLSAYFHDGRYHGECGHGSSEWPPAPARLFQALVAGAARGAELAGRDETALEWLEKLGAPVIAAPTVRRGQLYKIYVPNNDLDAVGGDPRKINQIRVGKYVHPHIFDARIPLLFVWTFNSGAFSEDHAQAVCQIAEQLYQLGRGIDMAWASAELLDAGEVETRLNRHGGVVYRPSKAGVGKMLLFCPKKGSFASLKERYDANRKRFTYIRKGRGFQQLFSQPPKPRFARVAYNAPPQRFLFELRAATHNESFVTWPSARTVELVVALRDKAADKLKDKLPEEAGKIDRVFIGCEATEADKAARIRILPLPSIGHIHADRAIRRVLVEVPPNCPLRSDDVAWTFSGLPEVDRTTREILWNLVQTQERMMLKHYGINSSKQQSFRVWHTVTPAALPVMRTGRRNSGAKRVAREAKVTRAVMQALRHAGVTEPVESVRVQREPFDRNGSRAEEFAIPERFVARGLHHVEITFARAIRGPLIIGNGRYLGLGLMAPREIVVRDALAFPITPNIAVADTALLLRSVRRALMALSRDGANGHVPRLFSGHEPDGAPAKSGGHDHIFLAADDVDRDGLIERLIVAAPWVCDHTTKETLKDRTCFDRVSRQLTNVRAGRLGILTIGPAQTLTVGDPLVGPACVWESRSPYRPTRHAGRGKDLDAAVARDIIAECERRGLPKPEVELLELNAGPNGGNLTARARLRFAVAVTKPIMLGCDSHRGGGLFSAVSG